MDDETSWISSEVDVGSCVLRRRIDNFSFGLFGFFLQLIEPIQTQKGRKNVTVIVSGHCFHRKRSFFRQKERAVISWKSPSLEKILSPSQGLFSRNNPREETWRISLPETSSLGCSKGRLLVRQTHWPRRTRNPTDRLHQPEPQPIGGDFYAAKPQPIGGSRFHFHDR